MPSRDAAFALLFLGDAVHANDSVHVPIEVVAIELDLHVRQAVERNPLGKRLRQAIADGLLHVGARERIERSDQMIERHSRLRLGKNEVVQAQAVEFCAEVMAKIVAEQIGSVSRVTVEPVGFAEGIVESRVERAGTDHGGQNGNRVRDRQALADRLGLADVLVFDAQVISIG